MAITKLEIWNRALTGYLGVGKLADLTTSTPAQEQCELHYDATVRALLEAHEWTWSLTRATLTAEATNDRSSEWAYKYRMPGDVLVIRWINAVTTARSLIAAQRNPDTPRQIYGDHVYSDVASAVMEYHALVEDPSAWSQAFADAVAATLASHMAMPLTENSRLAQRAMQMAQINLEKAIVHDEGLMSDREASVQVPWRDARGATDMTYPPILNNDGSWS